MKYVGFQNGVPTFVANTREELENILFVEFDNIKSFENAEMVGGKIFIGDEIIVNAKASALSRIDSATSAAILAGFEYEVETGEGKEVLHFSYDSFDQSNFNQTANIATLVLSGVEGSPGSVTWNGYRNYTPETGGELVRITLTPTAFLDLYVNGASAHKALQMELGGQKKVQIEACETVEEINALLKEWNI